MYEKYVILKLQQYFIFISDKEFLDIVNLHKNNHTLSLQKPTLSVPVNSLYFLIHGDR
jgi:hypothetical protein